MLVCMYACMYDLLLALCGQSTALELDYFSKQVHVKDSDTVSGGEGAGEGAEGPRGSGSGSHSKRQRDLEAQQAEEARRLGVDKGLFRRKPQPANAPSIFASKGKGKGKGGGKSRSRNSSDEEEEGRDIEAGPGSAGRGGAGNGKNFFSFSFGSDRQHVHPQSAKKSSQSMAGLIAEEPEATPLHAEDGPPAGHRPSPGPRQGQGDAEAAGAEGAVDAGPEGAERAPRREQPRLVR